ADRIAARILEQWDRRSPRDLDAADELNDPVHEAIAVEVLRVITPFAEHHLAIQVEWRIHIVVDRRARARAQHLPRREVGAPIGLRGSGVAGNERGETLVSFRERDEKVTAVRNR